MYGMFIILKFVNLINLVADEFAVSWPPEDVVIAMNYVFHRGIKHNYTCIILRDSGIEQNHACIHPSSGLLLHYTCIHLGSGIVVR